MKKILKWVFAAVSLLIAFVLTALSIAPHDGAGVLLLSLIAILFGSLVLSLVYSAWSSKEWKLEFVNSFSISIGISSIVFILGYLYTALQPMLLK